MTNTAKNTFKLNNKEYFVNETYHVDTGKGFEHFTMRGIVQELESVERLQPKITLDQQITRLLTTFDFEKVQKVMHCLDWTWYDRNGDSDTPSVSKLVLTAQSLLQGAAEGVLESPERDYWVVATGGFYATATREEDGELILDLKFVVESNNWSSEDTCY